jgi:hypothetical protein
MIKEEIKPNKNYTGSGELMKSVKHLDLDTFSHLSIEIISNNR